MSQCNDILTYLQSGRSLTPLEALDLFGCMRLGARIWELKGEGYPIESRTLDVGGKYVASYSLKQEVYQEALW